MLVAPVKPVAQEGGSLGASGAESTGFVGVIASQSALFMLLACALASAWFFYDRRMNLRKTRLRGRRRR